jgi:meso-butanediol dehydrogenase/(S,S)-butanediol dehydrogenase/diacetyl reductase
MAGNAKLEGKVAIVTGSGRGIGRGIAFELAKEGADIAVVDTDRLDNKYNQYGSTNVDGYQAALKVVDELKALGRRAIAIECDVTKGDQVNAMVKKTLGEFGKIDILVNNAGVIMAGAVTDLAEEAWDLMLAVNAKGVYLCCKAVAPHMVQQKSGKIINIASQAGKRGYGFAAHYCASKFANVGFTQSLAMELAAHNINVNAICPGVVDTAMWRNCLNIIFGGMMEMEPDAFYQHWCKTEIPLGREQTTEDIGKMAVFLATLDNETGQAFFLTGGNPSGL